MAYFNSISRLNVPDSMATYINSADPIYGTGADGDATYDGNTAVLGSTPNTITKTYLLDRDMYYNNLTLLNQVTISPNGYRIFVKNILTMNTDSVIGFETGFATSGSIMQGGASATAVTHSLGGSATGYTATAPTAALGGANYFKIPHQAITGYSVTASGGPTWLRGGAGGSGQAGGGIVIIAARHISGPVTGTAYVKAPGTAPAGGGVILIVSSASSLPASISTNVTGQNPGTYNYMQLV